MKPQLKCSKSAVLSALTALLVGLSGFVAAEPLTFVALGDMPYSDKEQQMMSQPKGSLAGAIEQLAPAFVFHYGDFKAGNVDCSDDEFLQKRRLIAELYPKRVVYTPGDNDWTDCDRDYMPVRRDELERLDKLKQLFFAGEGLKMASGLVGLRRQAEAPENVMWRKQNLMFATIHLPGSNNGRDEIQKSSLTSALDLADWRDKKNIQWIAEVFKRAEQTQAKALVMTFQADIFRPQPRGKTLRCSDKRRTQCDGFVTTREFLEFAAANASFPVLLVHGDTSNFCLEQPNAQLAPNLWRLNGPGDYKVLDGVKITVDTEQAMPFAVETLLSKQPPPGACQY